MALQCWVKAGHRRECTPGGIRDISKMYKTQTLRFIQIGHTEVSVTVKIIPLNSQEENISSVNFENIPHGTSQSSQTSHFELNGVGNFCEVQLLPHYIPESGVKKPVCHIVVLIDGHEVHRWTATVYHPRYGTRLAKDNSNQQLIFSKCKKVWSTKYVPFAKHDLVTRTNASLRSGSCTNNLNSLAKPKIEPIENIFNLNYLTGCDLSCSSEFISNSDTNAFLSKLLEL